MKEQQMRTFKSIVAEVAEPLSQGERNFKALHNPVDHKNLVPGVTDQDHLFNGSPRREDVKSASYENFRDDDESVEAYDKDTQVKKIAPEKDKDMKEETIAERDEGKKGLWFKKIAKYAAKKYGSKEIGNKVAGSIRQKILAKEDTIEEKTLTPAEMKKREEIAKAMGKSNPAMPMGKKMAIATAMAKKVAEAIVDPKDLEGEYQSTLTRKQKAAIATGRIAAKNKAHRKQMYAQGRYPIQSKLRNEETDLNEAIGDHVGLAKYADEHGRLDTDDLHTAAKHMKDHNMGALRRHLQDMDTDPRDKALEYVKKKHYEKLGYTAEEVEQIDELTGIKTSPLKKLGYVMKAGKRMTKTAPHEIANDPTTARKFTNTLKTLKKMNKEEFDLDEAKRGRPSKNASADGEEGGREHIIIQLRKAENLRGSEKKVEFNDNSKHSLNPAHVKKALDMHSGMRPMEKGEFEKRLAASHASFTSAIKGEAAPKPKPKISLGSMKKESMDPTSMRSDRGPMGTTVRRGADGKLMVVKHKGHPKEVKIGEAMDPVNQEDPDINNDGKVNKSDAFLKARRKAISKAIAMKEAEELSTATVKREADTQYVKGQKSDENMQKDSLDKLKLDPAAGENINCEVPPTQGNKPIGGEDQTHDQMAEQVLYDLYNSLNESNKAKFDELLKTEEGVDQLLSFAKRQGLI
jgi:hypothetical protein